MEENQTNLAPKERTPFFWIQFQALPLQITNISSTNPPIFQTKPTLTLSITVVPTPDPTVIVRNTTTKTNTSRPPRIIPNTIKRPSAKTRPLILNLTKSLSLPFPLTVAPLSSTQIEIVSDLTQANAYLFPLKLLLNLLTPLCSLVPTQQLQIWTACRRKECHLDPSPWCPTSRYISQRTFQRILPPK